MTMTPQQAAGVLRNYNNWLSKISTAGPSEITAALETAIAVMEKYDKCSCSFVMIMRDPQTDIAYCSQCKKQVDEYFEHTPPTDEQIGEVYDDMADCIEEDGGLSMTRTAFIQAAKELLALNKGK